VAHTRCFKNTNSSILYMDVIMVHVICIIKMMCYFNGSGVLLGICTQWNVEVTKLVFVIFKVMF